MRERLWNIGDVGGFGKPCRCGMRRTCWRCWRFLSAGFFERGGFGSALDALEMLKVMKDIEAPEVWETRKSG